MRVLRAILVVGGLGALAYGAWSLASIGLDNAIATVPWLAGAVLAHDAVLVPLTLALGALTLRWGVRPAVRRALVAVLVVLGSVTLLAVPVLGRFGARPDNETLLDRPAVLGWVVLALLVALGSALWAGAARGVRSRGSRHADEA